MTRKARKNLPAKNAGLTKPKKPRTEKQIASQFKPGNKANPLGAKAHNLFTRSVRKLTNVALAEITEMVMSMSVEEVEEIIQSKTLTIAQKTILRASLDASEHGEIDKFNTIVSRSVGAIPTQVQITSPDGSMSPNRNGPKLSPEELKEQINKKLDEIEVTKNASN